MFPTLSQYNRTIQLQGSDAFRTLKKLFFLPAKTSPIKIYNFGSGSFAVVFKALENNKEIAIRCFIGSDDDYVERYRKIDNYLQDIDESWKTNIQFLDNEIKVDGKYYPVLKMDWVDGKLLNKYIDNNLNNNDILSKLQKQFVKISNNLEENRIAHGDIQCGNIIVREINGKPKIKLIDYDGLYIPFFSGEKQKERGRSEFQHPNRSYFGFNEKIDRFSFWVILCALEALKFDKSLWKETMQGGFNTLDNMLFVGSDFSNPNQSKLFQKISDLNQPSLNFYIAKLQLSLNTSNIEKLCFFGQENALNDTEVDDSNNVNTTASILTPLQESNSNQYARLKITSTPTGASVRNKDFEKIGITPITVNKYKYINQEIKIIFGTKSKSRIIDEFSNELHLNFEKTVYKSPVINSPVSPTAIPPPPPKKEDSGLWIALIFFLIIFVVGFIVYNANNKSNYDYDAEEVVVDTTAVSVDTTALVIDTTAVVVDDSAVVVDTTAFVNSDTEPTVISSSNNKNLENLIRLSGGYIVDKIIEYNYNINSSKWELLNNTENYGELFLDETHIYFMNPKYKDWKQTKWNYNSFDEVNNNFILNDNYENTIIIEDNFNTVTFFSSFENGRHMKAYIYKILKKSDLVYPNSK